jgi:hypothetical protein
MRRRVCTAHTVSQRQAWSVLAVDRSSARYAGRRTDEAELRARTRAAAVERRRFGYRLIRVMLAHQGMALNLKKLHRLFAEERLQMKCRGGRNARPSAVLRLQQRQQADRHGDPGLAPGEFGRTARIAPGKPQQSAFAESFISRLLDELLNETLFPPSRSRR